MIEKSWESEAELVHELTILRAIDHPNIVKLCEIYLDHKYLHIVTELLEGGPIQKVAPDNTCFTPKFSEPEAAKMIKQCL